MKVKKVLWNIFILAVFACAVFYIGWITFRVKPGYCAIMTSKTSGVYEKPVVSGVFAWRWERLLPTNVSLETFDLAPYKTTQTVAGELPSSKVYKDFAAADADFSYNIKLNISMSITPEEILALYKANKIRTNEDLQEYYGTKSKIAASLLADSIIKSNTGSMVKLSALSESQILEILMNSKNEFKGMAISSVEIADCKIPDIEIYNKAKDSYDSFQKMLESKLEVQAGKNAESYVEMDKTMKQFEKIGSLMKTYPNLQDMFKTGDAAAIINALKSVK